MLVLVLEKENAVDEWKELLGPWELDVAQIEAPDRSVPSENKLLVNNNNNLN